jgi:hypothetical protein
VALRTAICTCTGPHWVWTTEPVTVEMEDPPPPLFAEELFDDDRVDVSGLPEVFVPEVDEPDVIAEDCGLAESVPA